MDVTVITRSPKPCQSLVTGTKMECDALDHDEVFSPDDNLSEWTGENTSDESPQLGSPIFDRSQRRCDDISSTIIYLPKVDSLLSQS
jgi:hypothetical protein